MANLPPHTSDIPEIDPRLWLDPDFRQRYQAQLARIEAVQEADTFLAYATQAHLFTELEEILEAGQQGFAAGYPRWYPVWAEWQERLPTLAAGLHPRHRQEIVTRLAQAKSLLDDPAFSIQAKAGPVLAEVDTFWAEASAAFQTWQKSLKAWREKLKAHMNAIWAEDYAPLKAAYIAAKAQLASADAAPSEQIAPDTDAIEGAIQRKATDIAKLEELVPAQGPLRAELARIQTHYVPKAEFDALAAQIKSHRRKRSLRRALFLSLGTVLVVGGLWWGPPQYQRWRADQIWAEVSASPSVASLQGYIDTYPGGRYARKADSLLRSLPSGNLTSYVDPLGRVLQYTGALRQLVPHGKGEAHYADSSSYVGYWAEGLPDSSGIWIGNDSSRYEGGWQAGQKHGQGVFTAPYFGTYTGAWQADQPQGQGTRTWPDGGTYSGAWQKGTRNGQGNWEHPDGSQYVGGWQADAFHGIGSYTDSTGTIYRGAWLGGLRAGKGQQSWPDGRLYQGDWRQDKRWGQGVLTWQAGGRFQGGWEADSIRGWGTLETRFRSTLDGYWTGREDKIVLQDGSGAVILRGKMIGGGLEIWSEGK